MAAPDGDVVRATHGYHPLTSDLEEILRNGGFEQLLVFGPGITDVVDHVAEIRIAVQPPVKLPQGVYWFSGAEPSGVLSVTTGASPGPSLAVAPDGVSKGSALDNALGWLDQSWDIARVVPKPLFSVGDDVIVDSTGQDGVVRPVRRFVAGRWVYRVFSGGRTVGHVEQALSARPTVDNAAAWVVQEPVSPKRFAATLSRAKLQGHFTDTMFSFRATRTIFRPYQFKPVQKLLDTGTLRLLIAEEVGLGKTIEAGLVWTEMEARRQADRVLVVCPSMLVAKRRQEMEDRFGFLLTELDTTGLDDLLDRLESDRLPRRAAYISSIERLRMWEDLERATELGLQFDLTIVDEAHAFRNSDTKSYGLGEQLQDWSDALVMLSATPINLRNRDLFNLLSLLIPGEFEDVESLERRLAPNAVLNRLTKSLVDPRVTNAERLGWLEDFEDDPFGFAIALRPDYKVLREVLSGRNLDAAGAVQVKRICSELHGLSAQVTRTRKVDVQEQKPLREPHRISVVFDDHEAEFYAAYYQWCAERAKLSGSAINFAMQMPLRLSGQFGRCGRSAARPPWGSRAGRSSISFSPVPGLLAKLMSTVRAEFQADEFVFDPAGPVFGGALCRVPSCPRTGRGGSGLCAAHHDRWITEGKPGPDTFAASTDPRWHKQAPLACCRAPGCGRKRCTYVSALPHGSRGRPAFSPSGQRRWLCAPRRP